MVRRVDLYHGEEPGFWQRDAERLAETYGRMEDDIFTRRFGVDNFQPPVDRYLNVNIKIQNTYTMIT